MNSTATALDAQAASNVVFLNLPQTRKAATDHTTTGPAAFSEVLHSLPKDIEKERQNDKFHVPNLPMKKLKAMYRHEWSSFHNMFYQRCSKDGGYICHPAINTFRKFLAEFGPQPAEKWTIDRKDPNNLVYSPTNCEWAPKPRQSENRRNVRLWADSTGLSLSIPEWSRRYGVPYKTIYRRLNTLRWSVDDAVRPARTLKARAINCKTGGQEESAGMTLDEYCAQAQRPDSPHLRPLMDMWRKSLADDYDSPVFIDEPKHWKMLKDIADLLGRGGLDAEKVLACVLDNWHSFSRYAHQRGAWNPPVIPALEYLRRNVNLSGNFYVQAQKEIATDEFRNVPIPPYNPPEHRRSRESVPMTTDLSWLEDY